ncbi:MAG: hypothetical protein LC768_08805 [Acidobacteria bacterium]|nr:hypothetical protein [Acidobacteriota bacterium]
MKSNTKRNIFLAVCCIGAIFFGQGKIRDYILVENKPYAESTASNEILDEEATQGMPCARYDFEYKVENGSKEFTVFCDGRQPLLSVGSSHLISSFWIIATDEKGNIQEIEADEVVYENLSGDLTGEGVPSIIVADIAYSPSRIFRKYHVLSFGKNFKKTVIDTGIGEAKFLDINKDGVLEVIVPDSSVSRDESGWTDTATPDVILEYREGEYKFSSKFMKRAKPKDFSAQIKKAKAQVQKENKITQEIEHYMTQLFYHGVGKLAWEFFDEVSVSLLPEDKDLFENEFMISLNQSVHFDGILEVNGWKYGVPEGEASCPEGAGRNRFVEIGKIF